MARRIDRFTAGDDFIGRGIVLAWLRLEDGEFRQKVASVSTVEDAKKKIQQAESDGWVLTLKAYGDLWFPTEEANNALDRQQARRQRARAAAENKKALERPLRVYRPVAGQSG
jgi:hypothetical protein